MINCIVLPNGDLLVTAGNDTRRYIAEYARQNWWGTLAELFEPYFTNGGYEPFDAGKGNPFVGLTSAPCVAESLSVEDDGTRTIDGRVWWYPGYEIDDPLESLKTRGRTIFALAGEVRP